MNNFCIDRNKNEKKSTNKEIGIRFEYKMRNSSKSHPRHDNHLQKFSSIAASGVPATSAG